jgi:RimJ/RimL family protein N-acetyltransferase
MPPPLRAARKFALSYRPFTDEDLPFVADLYASTRREEVAATGWPAETQEAFLLHQHEAQHRHYSLHYSDGEWLIVEREGEAIGRLYLHETNDSVCIVDISLLPRFRGLGIGGAVLRDILDWSHGRAKSVSIHVEKFNPARRLYLRLGFSVIADEGVYDLMRTEPQ